MKVYGIAVGGNGYGSGDIFQVVALKFQEGKDLEGNWVKLLGLFYIDKNGEPQMDDVVCLAEFNEVKL